MRREHGRRAARGAGRRAARHGRSVRRRRAAARPPNARASDPRELARVLAAAETRTEDERAAAHGQLASTTSAPLGDVVPVVVRQARAASTSSELSARAIGCSEPGTHARDVAGAGAHRRLAARHGRRPVRPREPPATSTWPLVNFVQPARAGAAASAAAQRRRSGRCRVGRAARRAGCRCRSTRTLPACSLPGLDHSPGFGAWKVAVATARTAAPATSPVEASTPLGTSHATTGRPRRVDRLDRLADRPARSARRSRCPAGRRR